MECFGSLAMNKTTVVCFGDSITMCAAEAEADRWTARLAFLLERHFPGKYDVFNRGIGGNTTALALDRIVTDVLALKPAMVLVEFGINDAYVYPWCRSPRVGLADYRRNLGEIVRLVRATKALPVLIVNHPLTLCGHLHSQGNGAAIGKNLEPYHEAVREIACTEGVPSIDLPRIMAEENLPPESLHSSDGVHLSPHGNRVYAELVFEHFFKNGAA